MVTKISSSDDSFYAIMIAAETGKFSVSSKDHTAYSSMHPVQSQYAERLFCKNIVQFFVFQLNHMR